MARDLQALALKDEEGGLKVTQVAAFAERLRQRDIADMNVCVIGVLGKFREGKSTILNIMDRFLQSKVTMVSSPPVEAWLYQNSDEKETFKTSKECQGCTQGLWITSEPYIIDDGKGTKYAVFLLDTQGLFDPKSTMELDSALFLLTSLICSFTVFNIMRSLSNDHLSMLAAFSKLAGKIRGLLYEANAKIFEDLVFLIRDALVGVNGGYGWDCGSSYLENGFSDVRSSNKKVLAEIQKAYTGLHCFLMPKIAGDPDDVEFRMTQEFVLPKFRDQVTQYLERMFGPKMMRPFQHKGKRRSCHEFADFIEKITTLFNDGKIPKAEDMLQAMVKFEFQVAVDQALAYYRSEIKKATEVPLEYEKLREHHEAYKKNCKLITTTEVAILARDPAAARPYISQLDQRIEDEFGILRDTNDQRLADRKAREEAARKEQAALQEAARVAQESKEMEENFSKNLAAQQERLEQMEATTEAERAEKKRLLEELAADRERNEREKHELEARLVEIQEKNAAISREQQAWRERENAARGRRDQLLREASTKTVDLESAEKELKTFRDNAPGLLNAMGVILSAGLYNDSHNFKKKEDAMQEKVRRLQSEIQHARSAAEEEAIAARKAAEEEAAAIKREQMLKSEVVARLKRDQFFKVAQEKEDKLETVERELQAFRDAAPVVWDAVKNFVSFGWINDKGAREQKEKVLEDRIERLKREVQRLNEAANAEFRLE